MRKRVVNEEKLKASALLCNNGTRITRTSTEIHGYDTYNIQDPYLPVDVLHHRPRTRSRIRRHGAGVFLSMRIFSIPDITTDGSFTLGGAVTAIGLVNGWSAVALLPVALVAGGLAGAATGWIHTRLKVHALLAGILVMTGLYSINLAILGRPNVPLLGTDSLFLLFPSTSNESLRQLWVLTIVVAALWFGLRWLLRTDFGLSMRATGNNETMIRALG